MTTLNIEAFRVGLFQANCYLVWPAKTNVCWIIDPGSLRPVSVVKYIDGKKLHPEMVIITHGHPDHIAGIRYLKYKFPDALIAIHKADVQGLSLCVRVFSPRPDVILDAKKELRLGSLEFSVIHTPGHTPGGICLHCANSDPPVVFVGDLIFRSGGYGRTDLPGGSEKQLNASIRKLFDLLPDETVVYPGHGRSTTIGEEREYW